MIISHITLVPCDNEQADAVVIGITTRLIPVRLNVIELDVVAIRKNVLNDFNIVVNVPLFLYFFLDLLFLSSKHIIISLMLLMWFLKLLTTFNFFLIVVPNKHFFLVVQMGTIVLFFVPFI